MLFFFDFFFVPSVLAFIFKEIYGFLFSFVFAADWDSWVALFAFGNCRVFFYSWI